MSRLQRSAPVKSNAFRTPVPVITHTCVPSVTGDGVDMFCFISWWLPGPSGRFHSTLPFARSMHQRCRLLPSRTFRSSATLRKTRSPQTIGVEPDQAGSATFHVTFSVVDHLTGRFFSPLRPFSVGPRHCGQFSAEGTAAVANSRARRMIPRKNEDMKERRYI